MHDDCVTKEEENEEEPRFEYGCRSFRPSWLQCCTSPKALLLWISWFACVQGSEKWVFFMIDSFKIYFTLLILQLTL